MALAEVTRALLGALVLAGAGGCGVGKGAPEWIGVDAAVVRCAVAGPNLELPRLFNEVPSPPLPTGLYARTMDPIALDQLGFERDRVVCATLQAPAAADLDAAARAIGELQAQRSELVRSTRSLGGCRCAYADALDVRALVPGCLDAPNKRSCALEPDQIARLQQLLEPLEAAFATTEIPRTHWRLAGRTDRIGRFVASHDKLIGRHRGGSEVFLNSTQLPPQPGTKLLAGLLALDHVVAVVRQDGGRGLLVVREIDDQLVLDHFEYTDWAAAGLIDQIDPDVHALLGYLDDAQLARYRAALEPPSERRELLSNPRKGYLVELDHAALERVDRATLIAAEFAELDYDEAKERRELPPLIADRVSYQVPFGTDGEVLRARLRLTDEGRQWFDNVAGQGPIEAASTLGSVDVVPVFEPARSGFDALFVLRGQPIEQILFAGAPGLPKLLIALASADPSAIRGEVDDFTVALPTGPLPGDLPSRPGIEGLRERLSLTAHALAIELVDGGRTLALELEPR